MTLKTKLSSGLGFLFLIIFGLVFFSSYYIQKLSSESRNILKDNYDSITYAKNMFYSLDDMNAAIIGVVESKMGEYNAKLFESGKVEFERNLKAENGNITEINEKEYVETLNKDYELFLDVCSKLAKGGGPRDPVFTDLIPAYEKTRQSINNMALRESEWVKAPNAFLAMSY